MIPVNETGRGNYHCVLTHFRKLLKIVNEQPDTFTSYPVLAWRCNGSDTRARSCADRTVQFMHCHLAIRKVKQVRKTSEFMPPVIVLLAPLQTWGTTGLHRAVVRAT